LGTLSDGARTRAQAELQERWDPCRDWRLPR
jgi:hypothetical protein